MGRHKAIIVEPADMPQAATTGIAQELKNNEVNNMETKNKVEQKTLSETKYHYLDMVTVLNGFYKGCRGGIVDYDVEATQVMVGSVQTTVPTIIYKIVIKDHKDTMNEWVWIKETDIKK